MSQQEEKIDSILNALRDKVNQLESRFNTLREEAISKFNEFNDCIESAKSVCHQATEMTTVLENKLVNASNEEKEWKDTKVKLTTTSMKDMVILNVSGEKYTTSVETLTLEKDTFFIALFSKQCQLERDPDDKTTRDGFDANAFHSRCNNKGPTITIIQSSNNYLFGGYTAIPWTSEVGSWKNDNTAFLFSLVNPYKIPPTKYLINPGQSGNAVNHHSIYGPYFGAGPDMYLTNASNSNNSSYTNFPSSYVNTTGKGNNTFTGARNFTASDIEVFKLA
ncbi:unnamed protein product [Rotaria sp. Silwood2]|nr:unnamed protein product [Rotaria sp. Silwood2]CAF4116487.1 unnamed protein product [Rotaria sp. Silwood2]